MAGDLEQGGPLLTPADVLAAPDVMYLDHALAIINDGDTQVTPDCCTALALFLQSRVARLVETIALTGSGADEALTRYEAMLSGLPREIEESDLLERLVKNLAEAKRVEGNEVATNAVNGFLTRREEKARLHTLCERAASYNMINLTDLRNGDRIGFTSVLPLQWGRATAQLNGEVIGFERNETGLYVQVRVTQDRRTSKLPFESEPYMKGNLAHLVGTVLWSNGYPKHPGKIAQGEALDFVDSEGKHRKYTVAVPDGGYTRACNLRLVQMTVEGTRLFPKIHKK